MSFKLPLQGGLVADIASSEAAGVHTLSASIQAVGVVSSSIEIPLVGGLTAKLLTDLSGGVHTVRVVG